MHLNTTRLYAEVVLRLSPGSPGEFYFHFLRKRAGGTREHVERRHARIGINHDQLLHRPADELDEQRLRIPELALIEDLRQRESCGDTPRKTPANSRFSAVPLPIMGILSFTDSPSKPYRASA